MNILQICSVIQMQEMGLFIYWSNENAINDNDMLKQNIKALKLKDVKSIFLIWSTGLLVATLFFLLSNCLCNFIFINPKIFTNGN